MRGLSSLSSDITMRLLVASIFVLGLALGEDVTIRLEKGTVKGVREDHDMGQYYYAFKGIRYAAPPTDKLRFKVRAVGNV